MIQKILCFLGYHKWGDWIECERQYYDDEVEKYRICKCCDKKEEIFYYDVDLQL